MNVAPVADPILPLVRRTALILAVFSSQLRSRPLRGKKFCQRSSHSHIHQSTSQSVADIRSGNKCPRIIGEVCPLVVHVEIMPGYLLQMKSLADEGSGDGQLGAYMALALAHTDLVTSLLGFVASPAQVSRIPPTPAFSYTLLPPPPPPPCR